MATVTPDELLRLWRQEGVTSEMAIGHLIQNLVKQQAAIAAMQSTLSVLRVDVDRTMLLPAVEPPTKGKRQGPKKV
jgi:hypothetical protein